MKITVGVPLRLVREVKRKKDAGGGGFIYLLFFREKEACLIYVVLLCIYITLKNLVVIFFLFFFFSLQRQIRELGTLTDYSFWVGMPLASIQSTNNESLSLAFGHGPPR